MTSPRFTPIRNSIRRSDCWHFGLKRSLCIDRALDSVNDAGEFGEDAVASGVHEAAVVLFDKPSIILR